MTTEYHKIQSVFKRDMSNKHKTLLEGQWTLPEFEFLQHNTWTFTEKVDGTNIRIEIQPGAMGAKNFHFNGRTDNAQIPAVLVKRLYERCDPLNEKLIEMFPEGNTVLYGEGYGAKIQKGGGNYRVDQDFVLFDVRVGPWWLQRADVEDVAGKLGMDVVPIIGEGTLHDAIARCRQGFHSRWGSFDAEGIVARPKTELVTRSGHRLITKIKLQDFVS